MDTFTVVTIVLTFTALAGWANDRFLRLPSAIGIMLAGLVVAGSLILVNLINGVNDVQAVKLVKSLHLDVLLIGGQGTGTAGQGVLLGILLFATALQIEPASMTRRVGFITWMATVGVILTALVTAVGLHFIMMVGDRPTYFLHLLLVGVILAPTDAVAAISLLRRTRAPARVREVIAGESLFNDGISIVLVLFLLAQLVGHNDSPFGDHWVLAFLVEAVGAVILGIVMGYVGVFFIKSVKKGSVIVLVTISVVLMISVISPLLYLSCPVACVVAGLIMGRSSTLRQREGDGGLVVGFWGLIENSLTAILFLMIGLELLVIDLSWRPVLLSVIVMPLLLFARFVALVIPWLLAKAFKRTHMSIWEVGLMTWCGLRGGVSIAMAVAVPLTIMSRHEPGSIRSQVMVVTIVVVIMSILVQGLTVERLARIVERRVRRVAEREKLARSAG